MTMTQPDLDGDSVMEQQAPYPWMLVTLVEHLKYKDWQITLVSRDRGQGSKGLTLSCLIECADTYHPDETIRIVHYFIVPAASYNERSWRRWLFERILDVEKHEAMEFFVIDGKRPYAPNHGPGNDPYIVFEEGTLQEKRTDYRGNERDTDAPES